MEKWLYKNIIKIAVVICIPLWLAFLTQYIPFNILFGIFLTIGAGWFAIVTSIMVSEQKQHRARKAKQPRTSVRNLQGNRGLFRKE